MPIVREPDAVPHRLHGATFHSFAAPATGSRELCAWRLEVAPGTAGAAHRVSREEVLLVLTGDLTVTLDGVTAQLAPGEAVVVPAGSRFRVDNTSAGPATAWVTTSVGLEATMADGSTISPPWVR
jgi:quercetin dioxygenase-like cupin family protein